MDNEMNTAAPADSAEGSAAKLTDREVMEHTASVWRYNPINEDGYETHTEYHAKYTAIDGAEIIGARARGKKHKHEGTNCDDWFETATAGGCIICVVADGAGSRQLSRVGARVSCEAASGFLKEGLERLVGEIPDIKERLSGNMQGEEFMSACGKIAPLIQEASRKAFEAVSEHAEKLAAEFDAEPSRKTALGRAPQLSDLASTFLAAVIIPLVVEGHDERLVVSAQIGDGCICALDSKADREHCLKLLGVADSGAFSGETDFLSDKNTASEVITGKTRISRGRSDIIMLMSDGVADDYFPANPMIKRLYLDLCLNGILPMEGDAAVAEDPAPIRFKSVTMSGRSVELQYAKQLCPDGSAEAVDILWDKRASLRCHSLEAFGITLGSTPQERLVTWLDNYNERGSFDDRTLVAVRFNKEEENEQR